MVYSRTKQSGLKVQHHYKIKCQLITFQGEQSWTLDTKSGEVAGVSYIPRANGDLHHGVLLCGASTEPLHFIGQEFKKAAHHHKEREKRINESVSLPVLPLSIRNPEI